ncbi:MAG: sodium:solute symporter, partial [Firmicutes bacterium]|nr:sodium:solute symporter [Bacillota bacterium]
AFVPTLAGLFVSRLTGRAAALSTVLGILAGALLFPDPLFSRGNLLYSFAVAMAVPLLLTIILNRSGQPFDYGELGKKFHSV